MLPITFNCICSLNAHLYRCNSIGTVSTAISLKNVHAQTMKYFLCNCVRPRPWGDHFSCTIHLDQSMRAKIELEFNIEIYFRSLWNLAWHCCICCNPAKRRVDFEDSWLIKSSFKTKDEMKACQQTMTKFQQQQKKTVWGHFKFRSIKYCAVKKSNETKSVKNL
jgi:hypothetical protein